ncbi:GNAT family N-acetyltransferase [Aeromonas veronii]|nr:GNAT family N-acetyltransferase [Aeromonas veronii]
MAQMTDPHDGLVSLQSALKLGFIQLSKCNVHKDLKCVYDTPNDSPRYTFAMLDRDNVVKATALFVLLDSYGDGPCFSVGYAVAEPFRGQGVAYEILEKSLDEFIAFMKGRAPRMYIETMVSVDNIASQKVSSRFISDAPSETTDELSGLPALHYQRIVELS